MQDEQNHEDVAQLELARQQALKYGQDLARIYVAEKSKREKLEIAYQTLSAVFTHTPDGLAVLGDDYVIRQTNEAFDHLVEMTPPPVGQAIDQVLHSDLILPELQRLTAENASESQLELIIRQPVKRALLANIARLQAGHLRGWVIALHDESRVKRLERQKAEFINIAAHELRTPLAGIMGYTELSLASLPETTSAADESQRDYLEAIQRSSHRLRNIVNELVQFAQIDQGDVQAEGVIHFSLTDLVNDVVADLRQYADEKSIALQVGSFDLNLFADAASLRIVLYQLVLNAINFNRADGYVRIEANEQAGQVTIRVSDAGIGIPQSDLDTIFEPFFQVEQHDTRRVGGLGLGLSIARRTVAQLSGNLYVESTLGEGSTFSISLPTQQPTTESNLTDLQAELTVSYQQALVYAQDIQKLYRQLQQANHKLKEANLQLEEANKLKSGFLGVISHELRSPFVAVDLALQAIPRYGTDNLLPEQRELLDQLATGIGDARKMIDSLIAYSSLLSKQGRLNLQPVNVSQMLDETASMLRPLAERRKLDLQAQTPPGLILPEGDQERIGEAVMHLIQNAIKFTPAGGEIVVRARSESDYIAVEVKDTGIGIPKEMQSKVWESFGQLSDAVRRGVEGLGLGLAMVRYVAVAHGGDVILESEPGVGSVIGMWLPLHHYGDTGQGDA